MRRRGFTLIEVILVMTIIGVLTIIFFRTYATISQVTLRLQQEKNVYVSMMDVVQPLQVFSDASTIDYTHYSGLSLTQGMADELFLTGSQGTFHIFTSGVCLPMTSVLTGLASGQQCILYVDHNGLLSPLTNPNLVVLSQVRFKIIPWESIAETFSGSLAGLDLMRQVAQPGFWIFFQMRTPSYGTEWARNVQMPVQQFFTLRF